MPRLRYFALTDSTQSFIRDDIKEFGRACPKITHLNLSGVSNLENSQLEDILGKLQNIKYLSLLRNNKLTNEFFTTLTSKVRDLEGLEMGGKPNAFQHNLSLDGVENLCAMEFSMAIKEIKFEYCSKIGSETIIKIAENCPDLRKLSIIRNFNEKSARIDDYCLEVLSERCPNLERLELVYSRKFDERICQSLGSGGLSKLVYLNLSYCPIQVSMEPIIHGCPRLHELKLAGDSWIRKLVLHSIARHPNLRIFHMGHFEHSDIDCTHVKPQDPVFSNYSTKGIVVA